MLVTLRRHTSCDASFITNEIDVLISLDLDKVQISYSTSVNFCFAFFSNLLQIILLAFQRFLGFNASLIPIFFCSLKLVWTPQFCAKLYDLFQIKSTRVSSEHASKEEIRHEQKHLEIEIAFISMINITN